MQSRKIKFIDLFAGMGGFRIAFEKQKCKCVFSSEIDKNAVNTYFENFGEYPSGDITRITSNDIPDFDILCAGFPCQPFSIAGKRLGFEDARGTLFFEVARILKEKKPIAFLLENVKGIVNHDSGKTLTTILSILDELGYYVEWRVLNAKDYGIPQNRERWYCVGFQKNCLDITNKNFEWPSKQKLKYDLSNIIKPVEDEKYKISNICESNIVSNMKKKNIQFDDYTLAYEIRPSRCQFACNLTSPCLTAKMGTGGNNIPVVISQRRKLTEKECLQIMGYPETYKLSNKHYAYKQLGNSVVVPVIELLAKNIIKFIKEENVCV